MTTQAHKVCEPHSFQLDDRYCAWGNHLAIQFGLLKGHIVSKVHVIQGALIFP
jgi:hypothetical protein